ncbi:MAG: hypothetical protein ACTSYA_12360 [Candidatus Kariarchaeaceae archaeon]
MNLVRLGVVKRRGLGRRIIAEVYSDWLSQGSWFRDAPRLSNLL